MVAFSKIVRHPAWPMDVHVIFDKEDEKPIADKIRAIAKTEDRKLAPMVKRLVVEAIAARETMERTSQQRGGFARTRR